MMLINFGRKSVRNQFGIRLTSMNIKLLFISTFVISLQLKIYCGSHFDRISNNYSQLADSVNLIITTAFVKSSATVNIVLPKNHDLSALDFKQELLSRELKDFGVIFYQDSADKISMNVKERKRFSIFVLRNFADFLEIYVKVTREIFAINGLYILMLIEGEISESEEIFKLLWKIQIINVIVMMEDESRKILVKSFKPFKKGTCNDTTAVTINEFIDGKFAVNDNFFPDKMQNLRNCGIRVALSKNADPFVTIRKRKNKTYDITGEDINLLNTLAERLNFKVSYTFIGAEGYLLQVE